MPKRVLGTISTNVNYNVGNVDRLGLKRGVADKSEQNPSKKLKSQVLQSFKQSQKNENGNFKENNVTLQEGKKSEISTRTIELKVKNISIASEKDKRLTISALESKQTAKSHPEPLAQEEHQLIIPEVARVIDFDKPRSYYEAPANLPPHVEDFDLEQICDIFSEPHYATDVFHYFKKLELEYPRKKYIEKQSEINKNMRAVLVDWMVEVQESFELNHETLYLAVKIVDHYLGNENVSKSKFQLLGATAILISAKFDERIPPSLDDFLYICDDAYTRRDIILMEIEVLRRLNYFIGFPLSYRFLRRYARCAKLSMEVLTLARFILEMSLMDYDLIEERDSVLAGSALLLALKMKGTFPDRWTSTLEFYSGYEESELLDLMYKLNDLISAPSKSNLKTIKTKYSHKIFFEVAKICPLTKTGTSKV